MTYMLTSNEEQIANEWKKYQGFTVRPLASTVSYYSDLIHSFSRNDKFMIYGGTPEIRNIFQLLDLPVTLLDKSEQVIHAMGRLTHSESPVAPNERFIKMDWLQDDTAPEKMDFIIGDDAINMVPWEHFDTFLKNTKRRLNKNGLFVCHLLVKPDDSLIKQNFYELLDEYREGKIKTHYDLASRLNFICFDEANYGMGWQQTIHRIGATRLNIFKPDFDFIATFGFCNSKFYCPPQDQFEKLISNYFLIDEIFYPHEHDYCLYEPVYVLKKL